MRNRLHNRFCLNCKKEWLSKHTGNFCSSNCNHVYQYRLNRACIDFNKKCKECNVVFIARRISATYCSPKCNNLALYRVRDVAKTNAQKSKLNKGPKAKNRILNKYKNDTNFRLTCVLRKRLGAAIKGKAKTGSAVVDLGCSIDDLKKYLENQFQPDMTWDNWSRNGWHIDHIVPLSKFDLSNREELLKACHYSNLQPLWAKDNIRKGNK